MPASIRPEVKAVLDAAAATIGVREIGTNRGPEVEKYLRSTDNPPGAPWCAAWCYFIVREGVSPFSIPIPYVKSAYCPTVETWAEDLGILSKDPAVGDTFLLTYGGRPRHTGFVTAVTRIAFATIEGNTNLSGGAEGDGVYARERPRSAAYRFVRWSRLLPSAGLDAAQGHFSLILDRKPFGDIPVMSGRALCPVRRFGEAIGQTVAWDHERQVAFLGGKPLPAPVTLLSGEGHLPVRLLASFSGRVLQVDAANRRITVG